MIALRGKMLEERRSPGSTRRPGRRSARKAQLAREVRGKAVGLYGISTGPPEASEPTTLKSLADQGVGRPWPADARRGRAVRAGAILRLASIAFRPSTMLRRFWLLFAQACTVVRGGAVRRRDAATRSAAAPVRPRRHRSCSRRNPPPPAVASGHDRRRRSLAAAARKATAAVVNIYTSKEVRSRDPLLDDRMLRRFFPDLAEQAAAAAPELARLRRHRLARRLRAHQPSRHLGRRRHPARARGRPRAQGARHRHRSGERPRRAEDRRGRTAVDHVRHARARARSATRCSRSATRSVSATR